MLARSTGIVFLLAADSPTWREVADLADIIDGTLTRIAASPCTRAWVAGALFAEFGSAGIEGGRSISNCVDCAGMSSTCRPARSGKWAPICSYDLARTGAPYGVTVAYRRYEAGAGFTQEIRVSFSCWLL